MKRFDLDEDMQGACMTQSPDGAFILFSDAIELVGSIQNKVVVKLLNGSSVAHLGTVAHMGDPNDVTVIIESQGMTFEAWDLERDGNCFIATSWKRLS